MILDNKKERGEVRPEDLLRGKQDIGPNEGLGQLVQNTGFTNVPTRIDKRKSNYKRSMTMCKKPAYQKLESMLTFAGEVAEDEVSSEEWSSDDSRTPRVLPSTGFFMGGMKLPPQRLRSRSNNLEISGFE